MKIDKNIVDKTLEGLASKAEAAQVAEWFASPQGQAELSERLVEAFDKPTQQEWVDGERVNLIGQRLQSAVKKQRVRAKIVRWAAAAVLVPILMLSGALVQELFFTEADYNHIVVAAGDKATVTLADGSVVVVNAGSKFSYPSKFGLFSRKVYLEGQAYFSVDASKRRPFIVDLGESSVKVMGTKFDVESYNPSQRIVVTLDSGLVNFESPNGNYALSPNEQLVFDAQSSKATISNVEGKNTSGWRYNILSLDKVPMKQMLEMVSRQFGVQFKITDTSVQNYTYSLHSVDQQLDELLKSIERITPVKFINRGQYYEVAGAK